MAVERLGTYSYFLKSISSEILEGTISWPFFTSGEGLQQITSAARRIKIQSLIDHILLQLL